MTTTEIYAMQETWVQMPNGDEVYVELLYVDGHLEIVTHKNGDENTHYGETNADTRWLFRNVRDWLVQEWMDENDWSPIDAGV